MTADLPLVSIIVITYNSSKYVLETLESAKAQTYQNIELIISDDGSTDKTIEICEKWLAENKDRFIDSQIITVEKNTGIPANCNRGVKASHGEWIKLIAGDDVLLNNCIKDNIDHVRNSDIKILFSKLRIFDKKAQYDMRPSVVTFFQKESDEQFKMLLEYNHIGNTPTSFIAKKVIEQVGYFDEEFFLIEDYPFWIKCVQYGNRIHFMNKLTVLYRLHDSSVDFSERIKNNLVNNVDYRNEVLKEKYIYPYYTLFGKSRHKYSHAIDAIFLNKSNTKRNRTIKIFLEKYLNPFYYAYYLFLQFFNKNIDIKSNHTFTRQIK